MSDHAVDKTERMDIDGHSVIVCSECFEVATPVFRGEGWQHLSERRNRRGK